MKVRKKRDKFFFNIKCNFCGKITQKRRNGRFCNRSCAMKYISSIRIPPSGWHHSEESKENIRKGNLGKKRTGQALENIRKSKTPEYIEKIRIGNLGKKRSAETREKNRISALNNNPRYWLGKHLPIEMRKKISIKHKGKHYLTPEHMRVLNRINRIRRIKEIEDNFGKACPFYNRRACRFFKLLDIKLNFTNSYYAMTKNGEFLIKSLGYWPDYINFDAKLIIEWDEKHHFNLDGSLKERDIKRQNEIKQVYPDYLFVRVNQITKKIMVV